MHMAGREERVDHSKISICSHALPILQLLQSFRSQLGKIDKSQKFLEILARLSDLPPLEQRKVG